MTPLDKLFALFIPADMHDDPVTLVRAQSLVALSVASLLAGPVFIGIYVSLGHVMGGWAIAATVFTVPMVQVALRVFKSLALARLLYLVAFTALFTYLTWSTGGRLDHVLALWLLVVPVMATFSGGPWYGAGALGLVVAILGGFELAHQMGHVFPTAPVSDMRLLGVASSLGFVPFMSLMVMGFQVAKEQSDRRAQQHLKTIRELMAEVQSQSSQVNHSVADMAQTLQNQSLQAQAVRSTTDANNALAERMEVGASALAAGAHTARDAADQGAEVVGSAITKTVALAEAIGQADELVGTLQSRSQQISAIADRIKQLAFQTNILALNATIEAAHAGPQGRGFAVVADNVRQLAGEAGHAAAAISAELGNVLQNVAQTARLLAASQALAESGRAEASKARASLRSILDAVGALSQEAGQLESMSREQVGKNAELRQHSANMEQAIREVADGSGAIREAMSALAGRLAVRHA